MGKTNRDIGRVPLAGDHYNHVITRNERRGNNAGKRMVTVPWRCHTCGGVLVYLEQWEDGKI